MRPSIHFVAMGDDPVPTCGTDTRGNHVVDLSAATTTAATVRVIVATPDPAQYLREWAANLDELATQIEAAS